MDKSPLISIIIPVYNTEKYLAKCLENVINQTYKNIEIVVVNDGSSDNSIKIINEFREKDTRFILIEQSNHGISNARNSGIKASKGEYIVFIDSDDWVDLEMCEQLVNAINEHEVDIVFCSYLREFRNGFNKPRYILDKERIFDKNESTDLRLRLFGLFEKDLKDPSHADTLGTIYSKLYRTNIIKDNNLEFIDLNLIGSAEDVIFNISYFKYVSSAYYIHQCLYHYRKINETSTTTNYRPQLFEQWQSLFRIINSKIESEQLNDNYKIALNNRIALSIFGLGLNVLSSDFLVKRKIFEIKNILSSPDYVKAYSQLTFKYFPFHWKVFFIFAKHQNAIGVYLLLKVIERIIKR
jgi:glycosyltransferase involved in cell wall biosynthesis